MPEDKTTNLNNIKSRLERLRKQCIIDQASGEMLLEIVKELEQQQERITSLWKELKKDHHSKGQN